MALYSCAWSKFATSLQTLSIVVLHLRDEFARMIVHVIWDIQYIQDVCVSRSMCPRVDKHPTVWYDAKSPFLYPYRSQWSICDMSYFLYSKKYLVSETCEHWDKKRIKPIK